MRCKACNSGPLSDIERRKTTRQEHIDLCNIAIPYPTER